MVSLRDILNDKITVTGNPYDIAEVTTGVPILPKKNRIILTNRPDYEKRPNLSLDIFSPVFTFTK